MSFRSLNKYFLHNLSRISCFHNNKGLKLNHKNLSTCSSAMYQQFKENNETVEAVVCQVGDLQTGEMKEVSVGSGKALLVKDKNGFHAVGHKCTHYGAPLAKGALGDGHVRCPWHGACFSYKSGDIEDFPGLDSIAKFEVTVEGSNVKVRARKEQLENAKRQKTMSCAMAEDSRSFVIVGGGGASITCAETLRQEGFKGKLTILSKDKNITYDRPKLSKALSIKPEDIALRKPEFYSKYNIDFQTDTEVTLIDIQNNSLQLGSGKTVQYDKLLLATGASPRQATFIKNHDIQNVHTLRSVEDGNTIAAKGKGKKVIIIGTSFIGLEVACFLKGKSESIVVIGQSETTLQNCFGLMIGRCIQKLLEEKGIKFYFKNSVTEFVSENGVLKQAILKDGTVLDADLCVVGIGVTPATDFLKSSELAMNERGFVTVDKHMQTNKDNVFAAGDITHFPLFMMNNDHVNVQHWQMAGQQGRIAALNMLGKTTEIKSVPYFWTVMFGKSLRYCGYGVGYDDIVMHGDLDSLKFVAYYTKGPNVIAVASLNYDPVVSQAAEMLLSGQPFTKEDVKANPTAWTSKLT